MFGCTRSAYPSDWSAKASQPLGQNQTQGKQFTVPLHPSRSPQPGRPRRRLAARSGPGWASRCGSWSDTLLIGRANANCRWSPATLTRSPTAWWLSTDIGRFGSASMTVTLAPALVRVWARIRADVDFPAPPFGFANATTGVMPPRVLVRHVATRHQCDVTRLYHHVGGDMLHHVCCNIGGAWSCRWGDSQRLDSTDATPRRGAIHRSPELSPGLY
jgi:hypothetical protein